MSNEVLKCKRCKRILKDDTSKRRGYGYICWKIHLLESQPKVKNLFKYNIRKNGGR